MRRVLRLGWALGISLLPWVPLQSGWANDGESLPTPGVGNEAWTAEELWRPAGSLTGNHGYKVAYNRGFVADGHLNLIFAPDGNRRNDSKRGIDVWDVSDPRRPSRVRTHRNMVFREAHGLGLWNRNGRTVLAAQSQLGVAFFDVTDISERLTLLGEADLPGIDGGDYGGAWWVSVQAPYVYVATLGGGLHVVDASDPAAPRQVTRLPTGKLGGISPASVFAVGNLLVLAEAETARGYATMDIGDPENPTLIATMNGSAGYSHLFTAGMILTSGGNADLAESARLHVHRVGHDGSMSYVGEAGGNLGQGAYGSYQDGHFLGGFSRQVAKFTLNPLRLVGTGTSGASGRDEEFAQPLGNLLLATDDHGIRSTLIPHQMQRDTTGPNVVWKHPPAGATNQPLTTRVGVSMSDEVAVESLLPATFRVAARDGDAVSGQLSANQNNVNFSPDAPLAPSTTYDVEVCRVKDLVGNAGGCSSWSFETGTREAEGVPTCRLDRLQPVETATAISYSPTATKNQPTAFTWSFGGAGTVGPQDQAGAEFTYPEPGRYAVVLEVSNAHGAGSCSAVQIVHTPLTATAPVSSSSVAVSNAGEVLANSTDIYVANPDNDTVTRVHWDLEKVWEVAVGDDPRTLAIAPNGHIWVANRGSGDITVLHPFGKHVRTIDLGYGAAPYGIVFAPDESAAYVSLSGSGRLLKLDLGGHVVGDIAVGARARGIAVSGDSKRIFVTRFVSAFAETGAVGEVYEVDAATFGVTRTIELAFDPGPDSELTGRGVPNYLSQIRIAPDGRSAWIPSKKDNIARGKFRDGKALDFETQTRTIVSQIDLLANAERLASRIDFDDRDLAQSLLFTPVGDAFMVAFQGSNRVEVWDTNERARLSEVSVGRAPAGMALDPSGRRLYVHNFLDRSLSVFNIGGLLDGTVNEPIPIETVPLVAKEALAAEALRGKRIFYDSSDSRMGRDGYISCASCHLDGGSDQMVWDRTQAGEGLRNTIDLRGRRGTNGGFVHWTSNFDEIQDFEHDMRDGFDGTGFMSDAAFGTGTRNEPLGDPKAGVSAELDALAAYVTSLDTVGKSPHRAADGSLTADGRKGRATFTRKGCAACHAGADFTDDRRHDVGTHDASSGKGSGASLDGVGLNTPTLKGLWIGAPYLHNGSAATLLDVLDTTTHMGGVLTSEEKEEIAAFLVQIDDSEPGVPVAGEVAADDPSLSTLALSGIDIGTFDAATTAYAASVEHGVSSTTVTAAPKNDAASVTIKDADGSTAGTSRTSNLAVGANTITATVTAQDGETTRTYTVTVTRAAAPPVASIAADAGSVAEGGSAAFTISLDKAAPQALTLPLSVSETGQTLSGTATSVSIAQGATSAALTLATVDDNVVEEDSTITVQLSAGDGYALTTSVSAHVSVEDDDAATFAVSASPSEIEEGGAADVTVAIANAIVFGVDQTLALTASGTASADDYALSASALTLSAGDAAATAVLTAIEDAATEEAETVTVTASHGGADVGSATVTIAANTAPLSDDATLSALELSGIDIAFDSATTSYSADVGNGVESTTVTATPNDAAAAVVISDAQGSTAGTTRPTALGVGSNAITVVVTAEDGETSLTYNVEVARAASPTWGERRPGRDIDVTAVDRPTGLWSDGETLWVADWGNSKALAYTLADGSRLKSGDVSLGETYSASGLWSDGETLWVADYNGGVLAYGLADGDRRSGRDLDGEVLADAGNARPAGVWSDGETVWVGDHNDGKVYAYGLADKARLPDSEFTLQAQGLDWVRPFGLWSNGRTLLASSWDQGVVRAYRLSDGARVAGLDIAASANAYAAGLWSDGDTLWVLDDQNGKLLAYALAESDDGEQKPADATLSALTLTGIDIGVFDAATTDYAATVAHDVSSTSVTATATDAGASVTITGGGETVTDAALTVALASGANTITATVTAEDGQTTQSYTVTVTRETPSADATLSALTLSGIDIGTFESGTTAYTASVDNAVSSTTVTATPNDASAVVTITDPDGSTEAGPRTVSLAVGETAIKVEVTAEDGETTQSYTVTVTRAAAPLSTDATLSALALSGIDIGTFDAETTAYAATVAHDVSSTTVTATATDDSATVTLTDGESSATDGALDVSLGYGANTITVTVTAEDGQTTQSYVVTVTRPRGAPTIRGTPQVGEMLTASTDTIADEDGLDEVEFSYQWIGNDGTGDADIANATRQTYTPVAADAGKTLKVRVTFTDGGGTVETLTSAATDPVAARSALSVADAEATEEDETALDFVVTMSPTAARTVTVDYATADGTATAGADYTATRGALTFDVGETSKTVSVPIANDTADDGGETLTLTLSNATVAEISDASATGTIWDDDVNTPPTGVPTITGTAQVGEMLTASTAGIDDADGVEEAEFSYQWIGNGGTGDTDIAGATKQTYTPVAADAGKTLKVRVTFTDGGGTVETLTSAATEPVAARSALSVADAVASEEEDTALDFEVTLNPAAARTVTVDYATADDTATAGDDYTATNGTLTFGVGETSKTVSVPITDDTVEDGGETLTLTLSNATVAEIADASATGTINNAEPLTASFSEVPESHAGAAFTFVLTFSEAPKVSFRTLREEALDVTDGTVEKAKRRTPGSNQSWEITVAPAGTGAVTIELPATSDCAATGAICTADGRALSNSTAATVAGPASDAVDVSIAADAASVGEGTPAAFTLTRTGDVTATLTVAVGVSESGAAVAGTAPTSAGFAAGAATAALTVPTADDAVVEADSVVTAAVSAGDGYRVSPDAGSAVVSVTDNDVATFAVTVVTETVLEGASATFRVAVANGVTFPAAQTIPLTLGGSASTADYALSADGVPLTAPYALTLPSGASETLAVLSAVDDSIVEPAETVKIDAHHGGALIGTATVTIPSDDAALRTLTLSGIDIGTFDAGSTSYAATVDHAVASTTVTAMPNDAGASVAIADAHGTTPGTSRTSNLAVGENTITATVTAQDGETTRTYTVTVTRAAAPPVASIAADAGSVAEGGSAAFTISLDKAAPQALTLPVSVSETGQTLSGTATSVSVAQGATSAPLTLATVDDNVVEADSTITVQLSAGDSYALGTSVSAQVSVEDNDAATFTVSASPSEIEEGGTADVTVAIANGVVFGADQALALTVSGTASADDYVLSATALTLAAGDGAATATLTATDDAAAEEAETVTVTASHAGEDIGSATVTIAANTAPLSDDATLSALELSGIDIAFDSATTSYTADVGNGVESTTTTATPNDAAAVVVISDAQGSTAGRTRTTRLAEGSNVIGVAVTAENGQSTREYSVTVMRATGQTWGARLPQKDIDLGAAERPRGLWSDGDTVWAADWSRGEVVAYKLSDAERLEARDFVLGSYLATALTSDGTTLWAADYDGGVYAYRLSDGERLPDGDLDAETMAEAGNGRPSGLWTDGETLWVADYSDGHVYAYGVADGVRQSGKEFSLQSDDDTAYVQPFGLWSDGETLLATDWSTGTVRGYVLAGGARRGANDIDGETTANSYAAGLWSDGETLWVVDEFEQKAYAYMSPGLKVPPEESGTLLGNLASRATVVPSGTVVGGPVWMPDPALHGRVAAALGKRATDAIGVGELAAVVVLDARGAGIDDLTGLEHAVNLEGLDLANNPVSDLGPLESLPGLRRLNLDGVQVDLWQLHSLRGLTELSLRGCGLDDVSALSSQTGLAVLDLGGNRVEDLGPLSGLVGLRVLGIRDNAVTDLAPLAGLPRLQQLDVRGNRIADFSVLDVRDGLRVVREGRRGGS